MKRNQLLNKIESVGYIITWLSSFGSIAVLSVLFNYILDINYLLGIAYTLSFFLVSIILHSLYRWNIINIYRASEFLQAQLTLLALLAWIMLLSGLSYGLYLFEADSDFISFLGYIVDGANTLVQILLIYLAIVRIKK